MILNLAVAAVLLLLSSCSTVVETPQYPEKQFERIKVEVQADCDDQDQCEISASNLDRLVKIIEYQNDTGEYLTEALNHAEIMAEKRKQALIYVEQQLRREQTVNTLKTWGERLLFILGIWAFGTL